MSSGCECATWQESGWACRFWQESENRTSVALCLISPHSPFQLFSMVQGSVDRVLESWHHHGFWFHPGRKIKCEIWSRKSARQKEVCFPGTRESSLRQEPKQWQQWEWKCGKKWHFCDGTKYITQAHLEHTCEQHKGLLGRGGGQKWVMPNGRKHTEFMWMSIKWRTVVFESWMTEQAKSQLWALAGDSPFGHCRGFLKTEGSVWRIYRKYGRGKKGKNKSLLEIFSEPEFEMGTEHAGVLFASLLDKWDVGVGCRQKHSKINNNECHLNS